MNNDPDYPQRLREAGWRRPLTETEQAEWRAWLAAHPEAAADLESEAALNAALARLPDAPVPTNFTARVRDAVARETAQSVPRPPAHLWLWRVLLPRAAAVMLVLGVGAWGAHLFRVKQRKAIGDSLVTIATVPTMPTPQALEDFDAILKLDSGAGADRELIALLQ